MISDRMQEIFNNYKDKIIIQYNNEQNRAILQVFLESFLNEVLLFEIQPQNAYNLETAVGSQLDTIGVIVGVDRFYSEGALDDDTYRMIIKLKIVKNNMNYSMSSISELLFTFFEKDITPYSDNEMDITFLVKEDLTLLVDVAIEKELLPSPSGVLVNYVILSNTKPLAIGTYDDTNISSLCEGFGTYDDTNGGNFLQYDNIINL